MADDPLKNTGFRELAKDATNYVFGSAYPSLQKMLKTVEQSAETNTKNIADLEQAVDDFSQSQIETNSLLSNLNSYVWKSLGLLTKIADELKKNTGKSLLESLLSGAGKGAGGVGGAKTTPKSALSSAAPAMAGGALLAGGLLAADKLKDGAKPVDNKAESIGDSLTPKADDTKPNQQGDAKKVDEDLLKRQKLASEEFKKSKEDIVSKSAGSPAGDAGNKDFAALEDSIKKKYNLSEMPKTPDANTYNSEADLPSKNAKEVSFKPEDENSESERIRELKKSSDIVHKATVVRFDAGKIIFENSDRSRGGFGFDSPAFSPGSGAGGGAGAASADAKGGDGSSGNDQSKSGGGGASTAGEPNANPQLAQVTSKSGRKANVSKDYASKFQGFVNDLENTGYNIKDMGGYNMRRNVNNPSKWSKHAFGAALDINAASNPNRSTQTDLPPETGQLAQKWGLGWGMNWNSVKDPMHFSAAKEEGGSETMGASPIQGGGSPSSSLAATSTPPAASTEKSQETASRTSNIKYNKPMGSTIDDISRKTSDAASSAPPGDTTFNNIAPAPSAKGNPNPKLADPRVAGRVEPEDASSRYSILFDMRSTPRSSAAA